MAVIINQQLKELYPMFFTNNQVIKEEFLFCTACDDQASTIDNKLIQCKVCFTTVHELCHQDKYEKKQNYLDWMCLRCEEAIRIFPKKDQLNCYICPQTNLIMKFYEISENKKFKSIWAHIGCVKYVLLMDFDFSKKGQQGLICSNCKTSEGFLMPCAHKNCNIGFHVGCAKYERLIVNKEGMNFVREHYSKTSKDQIPLEARIYCDKHLDLMKQCLYQRVYRETTKGIKLDQMMVLQQASLRFQTNFTDVRALRRQWTLCNNFRSKSIFALKSEFKIEKMEQMQKVENNLQQIIKGENQGKMEKVEKVENNLQQIVKGENLRIDTNEKEVGTQQQMKIVDNETEVVTTSKKRKAPPKLQKKSKPTQKKEIKQKIPTQKEIRSVTKTLEQEVMKSYNEELDRIYSQSLEEFNKNNKSEFMSQNNTAIELDLKMSQVLFSKYIEIFNLEAFLKFFSIYLYVNELVENGRVVFRKSQTSVVVQFWRNMAEKADILENIKLDQFILQIRDNYMKVIDKDKVHDEQFQIYQQIIDESESMPIL